MDQFHKNMVIVCTADVLHHCLHHGFITISQINLLIFDEAHHAKKDHAYSRIIKDFYTECPEHLRPKIFGMTASPVDSKTNVANAAIQLESLLHSHIVTASDPSLLQFAPQSKKEEIIEYQTLGAGFETELFQKIKSTLTDRSILAKQLIFSRRASAQLGPWCSDQIWLMSLSEEKCKKLEVKIERGFHSKNNADSLSVLDARKAEVWAAKDVVTSHLFEEPQPTIVHLSHKVLELCNYLKGRFERPTDDKCIVFVEQRYTAMLLNQLFAHPNIGTPYLLPGFLIGAMTDDVGDVNVNFRQQVLTLVRFRTGRLNCLFATSVAEEGLDVPDCNLVIRFDLYKTLIQYIQSRGRARLPNSRYIHMMEKGNREHQSIIRSVCGDEVDLRGFCNGLDPSRLLSGNDYNMDFFLAKEKKHRIYKDPETGSVSLWHVL